jgi:hypothetical protein
MQRFSKQRVESLIAAFAAGSIDETRLTMLPKVSGQNLNHLIGTTGIHRIYPSEDEDYFAMSAMVGRERYVFWFTISPKAIPTPQAPDLATLLARSKVTQYHVIAATPGKPASLKEVACHSRQAMACGARSD